MIFDGPLRAPLAPALMKLFGQTNWHLPVWARIGLRLTPDLWAARDSSSSPISSCHWLWNLSGKHTVCGPTS